MTGTGVVGIAVARALALCGYHVVIDKERSTGTSLRNAEVIHSGIHYPAGILKANSVVMLGETVPA